MARAARHLIAAILLVAALLVPGLAIGQAPAGIPAAEREFSTLSTDESYPVLDLEGRPVGRADWVVVPQTGNCCENYLAATPDGRLLDFGGTHLKYTDDLGKSWMEVRPLEPLVSGEGAINAAPGGDIIGMTWDPYSGDRILTYKYDAASEGWQYSEQALHRPFYDRPWLAVIDGPFTVGPITVPYISVLLTNFFTDGYYYSLDGLNYTYVASRSGDSNVTDAVEKWLDAKPKSIQDYLQPHFDSGVSPIPGGGALGAGTDLFVLDGPTSILEPPDLQWAEFAFPSGPAPEGRMLSDSRGYLHVVRGLFDEGVFTYSVSRNGGRQWEKFKVKLPAKHRIENIDFKAHGELGMTAIAVHSHDKAGKPDSEADRDLLYILDVGRKIDFKRLYQVGNADIDVGRGVGASLRFDFATVAILPDGTIAMSFVDDAHRQPSVAILRAN